MSDPTPAPDSSSPERRADSAEIFEEFADGGIDRLQGTFYVVLNYDDEDDNPTEGDFEDDPDEHDDDAWTGDPEDWDEETIERWNAEAEERASVRAAAREAQGAADPRRELTIDDAIAFGRAHADDVRVWIDGEFWDASAEPRSDHPAWPPAGLDLRPRWDYEPATAPRADAWWVRHRVEAAALTPALARAAADRDPAILAVRSATRVSKRQQRRWRQRGRRGTTRVDLECLVAPSDGASAVDSDAFLTALGDLLPPDRQMPPKLRLRRAIDRLLRRERTSTYWTSMDLSPRALRPATAGEIAAARDTSG